MYNTKPVEKALRMTQEMVADASRQVWLAGLGAAGIVGDTSITAFDTLIREGEKVEQRQRRRVKAMRADVTDVVQDQWKSMEKTLQQRLATLEEGMQDVTVATLKAVGMPTRVDLRRLNSRLEQLSGRVEELSEQQKKIKKIKRTAPRTRTVARKGAARGR